MLWAKLAYYAILFGSESPKDVSDSLPDVPASQQMVPFLALLHSLGGQDDKDRVFHQEVVDQNAAKLIVIPLFLFTPILASRLVQFIDDF